MRQGYGADIITLDDGTFVGFDLASDSCAEHEWGIKDIKSSFGLGEGKGLGVKRRQITKVPKRPTKDSWYSPRILEFFQKRGSKKESYIVFDYDHSIEHLKNGEGLAHELRLDKYNKNEVAGAWDDNSFGVGTKKYHEELKELYDAFNKKDIVIGLFGGHVFQNAGLKILIASKVPEDIKKEWYDADADADKLAKADQKTGIRKNSKKLVKNTLLFLHVGRVL